MVGGASMVLAKWPTTLTNSLLVLRSALVDHRIPEHVGCGVRPVRLRSRGAAQGPIRGRADYHRQGLGPPPPRCAIWLGAPPCSGAGYPGVFVHLAGSAKIWSNAARGWSNTAQILAISAEFGRTRPQFARHRSNKLSISARFGSNSAQIRSNAARSWSNTA